ncbi:hypothetical protein C8Q73DRAFT_152384 [Cubamyces lactineus]|nr:hypothetical protein C8Q73DRAFT_152384 [Cubamyces lactineus]
MTTPIYSAKNSDPQKSLYVVPAETPEKKRLAAQYLFKRALYGWNSPIPPVIDVSHLTNVLDVAAGTCIWTFDFASLHGVSERLSEGAEDRIHLYACDIETKVLPEKSLTDPLHLTTFQHDVTMPFPKYLHGKFDLVHISFLLMCLTKDGWKQALRHCNDVLKLGGMIMIDEADPVLYAHPSSLPPDDGAGHDLKRALTAAGWIGQANRICVGMSIANDFLIDISFRLPELLRLAGFDVQYSVRKVFPNGPPCRSILSGPIAAEYEEFTVTNFMFICKYLAAALLAQGKLYSPDGTLVATEEAKEKILVDVTNGLRQEGGVTIASCYVARKV